MYLAQGFELKEKVVTTTPSAAEAPVFKVVAAPRPLHSPLAPWLIAGGFGLAIVGVLRYRGVI